MREFIRSKEIDGEAESAGPCQLRRRDYSLAVDAADGAGAAVALQLCMSEGDASGTYSFTWALFVLHPQEPANKSAALCEF